MARSSGVALVANGTRSPLDGSMREIVRSSELSTQTAPSPTATADGVAPAGEAVRHLAEPRVDRRESVLRAERERFAAATGEQDPGRIAATTASAATASDGGGPTCASRSGNQSAQPGRRRAASPRIGGNARCSPSASSW